MGAISPLSYLRIGLLRYHDHYHTITVFAGRALWYCTEQGAFSRLERFSAIWAKPLTSAPLFHFQLSRGTPGVIYTYSYYITTPIAFALKNHYRMSTVGLSRISNGYFKKLLGSGGSLLKPPHGGFRIETAVT
jgi:hypothetical protein